MLCARPPGALTDHHHIAPQRNALHGDSKRARVRACSYERGSKIVGRRVVCRGYLAGVYSMIIVIDQAGHARQLCLASTPLSPSFIPFRSFM